LGKLAWSMLILVLRRFGFWKSWGMSLDPVNSCEWYWIDIDGFGAKAYKSQDVVGQGLGSWDLIISRAK